MLTWWLSQVSVKNGRHSSELPTRKSCQLFLLTSESGLSLCWAKSTHRKGVLHTVHSPFPVVPSSSRQRPPLDFTSITSSDNKETNNKATMLPHYTHCKDATQSCCAQEKGGFLIPLFKLGSQGLCLICSSTSREWAYLSQVGFCVTAGNLEGVRRVKFPGSCFLPSSLIQQTHLPILPSFCLGTGSQKIQ